MLCAHATDSRVSLRLLSPTFQKLKQPLCVTWQAPGWSMTMGSTSGICHWLMWRNDLQLMLVPTIYVAQ